jgi:hypothetical protein
MKTMKRFLIASMVLGTVFFATINVVVNEKTPIVSNVILKNLEAFTEETGESGGFDCQMKKDKCTFEVQTYLQITILRNKGYTVAGIGAKIDLSNGTQIYYKESWYWPWEDRVRCGTDVTCNTYQRQLGLIS